MGVPQHYSKEQNYWNATGGAVVKKQKYKDKSDKKPKYLNYSRALKKSGKLIKSGMKNLKNLVR